jgi:hypothetical protein
MKTTLLVILSVILLTSCSKTKDDSKLILMNEINLKNHQEIYGDFIEIDTIVHTEKRTYILNKCFIKRENRISYNVGTEFIENNQVKEVITIASGEKKDCLNTIYFQIKMDKKNQ